MLVVSGRMTGDTGTPVLWRPFRMVCKSCEIVRWFIKVRNRERLIAKVKEKDRTRLFLIRPTNWEINSEMNRKSVYFWIWVSEEREKKGCFLFCLPAFREEVVDGVYGEVYMDSVWYQVRWWFSKAHLCRCSIDLGENCDRGGRYEEIMSMSLRAIPHASRMSRG